MLCFEVEKFVDRTSIWKFVYWMVSRKKYMTFHKLIAKQRQRQAHSPPSLQPTFVVTWRSHYTGSMWRHRNCRQLKKAWSIRSKALDFQLNTGDNVIFYQYIYDFCFIANRVKLRLCLLLLKLVLGPHHHPPRLPGGILLCRWTERWQHVQLWEMQEVSSRTVSFF